MEGSSQEDGCKNCKELKKRIAELELQRRVYSTELEAELKKGSPFDKKSASDELRQLERYKSIYLSSSDAIMTIEPPVWKFTSGNPATIKMFGAKDEKEFTTLGPWDVSPKNQPDGSPSTEKAQKMIALALKNGSNFFQWTHKRYKGEDFPATVLLTKTTINGKDVVQATVRDISEQNKAEEKEEDLKSMAESMPQIVWATTPDGKNIYFNHRWVDYTGMTLEESYGDGWNKPFHPDDQKRAWDAWANATKNRGIYSIESRLRAADGSYRWFLVRGEPMVDKDNKITKWFGTCTDIQEQKKEIEESEKLNKLMIGRELKMIELKKALRQAQGEKNVELKKSPADQVAHANNRFQAGIELEESVVQSLAEDYEKMVQDSDLDEDKKIKIIDNLEILLTDSRRHEQLLKDLA